jgi:hypothetical protein
MAAGKGPTLNLTRGKEYSKDVAECREVRLHAA